MKILIADDDRVSLMMMRRMLLQSGYDVSTVSDGSAAVREILQDDGPRLLLLDWMMPELNGPEVCRAIRASAKRGYIYVILLTAKDSKEDVIAGLEAGADDYLTKPCHPEELMARLRTGQRILQLEDGLVEARDEMHFRANYDALTGLLNRGAVVQKVAEGLKAVRHSKEPGAVLLCDVDHFKKINDTYGHPVGDEVLRAIARRLESLALNSDAVGRFGGEEFLFLLRDVPASRLASLASNVCSVIRASPIETSAGPLAVTISVGALGVSGHDDIHLDDVLKRADQLLYQAKRHGRDRAVAETSTGMQPKPESCISAFFPPALLFS